MVTPSHGDTSYFALPSLFYITQGIRDHDRFFGFYRISLKHVLNLFYLAFLNIITENFFEGIFEAVSLQKVGDGLAYRG